VSGGWLLVERWLEVDIVETIALVQAIAGDEGGGLLGRYLAGGRLQPTYDYLVSHHFLPVGLAFDESIALGDNFIAEYVLRISFFGYLILLGMLWMFLRANLHTRGQRVGFMLFFLAADIGYPLLPYPRVAACLPFFMLLWRIAADSAPRRGSASKPSPEAPG
jgi:hypothetical protein